MRSGSMKQYGTCVNTNYSSGFYRNNTWSAPNTVVTAQNKLQSRVNYLIHLRNGANKNRQNSRHKNHEDDQDQKDMYIHTNKGVEIVRLKNYVGKEEESIDKSKYERVLRIKDRMNNNVTRRSEQPMSVLLENERKREKEGNAADGDFFYINEVKEIGDNQNIRIDEKGIVMPATSDRIAHDMIKNKEKKVVSPWDEEAQNNMNHVCKWDCAESEKKKSLQVSVMNKEINKHNHRTWMNRKNHNYAGNHLHHTNNESSCKGNGNNEYTSQEAICTNAGSNYDETTSSEECVDTSAWELKRRLLLKKVNMSNIVKRIRSVIHHDYEEATSNMVEETNVIHQETEEDKKNLSEGLDSVTSESVDDNDDNAKSVESLDSKARHVEIMNKSEFDRNAFVKKLEELRLKLLNDRKVTCKDNFINNDVKDNFESDDQSDDSMKHSEEMNDMNFDKNIVKEPVSTFQEPNKQMRKQETENSNVEVIKEKLNLNEEEKKDSQIEILLNFIEEDNGKTNETNVYDHFEEQKSSIMCRKEKDSHGLNSLKTNHSYVTETIEHRTNTLLHRERERNNAVEFEDNYNLCDQMDFPCIQKNILRSNNTTTTNNNKDSTNIVNVPLERYNKEGNFSEEFSGGPKGMGRKVVDTKDDSGLEPSNETDTIKQRNGVCNSKKANCSTNNKRTKKRNKRKKKNMKKNRFCHINNVHIQNINIYINNDDKNKGVTVRMDGISKQENNEETNSNNNKNREEKNKLKNLSKKIVVESSENEHVETVCSHLNELDNKV